MNQSGLQQLASLRVANGIIKELVNSLREGKNSFLISQLEGQLEHMLWCVKRIKEHS